MRMKTLFVLAAGALILGAAVPAHRVALGAQQPDSAFMLLGTPGQYGTCANVANMVHEEMNQKYGKVDSYMYLQHASLTQQRIVTVIRDSLNVDVSVNDMVSMTDSAGRRITNSLVAVRVAGSFQGMRPPQVVVENGVVVVTSQPPAFTPLSTTEMARARELGDWVYRRCGPKR